MMTTSESFCFCADKRKCKKERTGETRPVLAGDWIF